MEACNWLSCDSEARVDVQVVGTHQDGASLVTQMVRNLPAMQETWVRPLGWEDSL